MDTKEDNKAEGNWEKQFYALFYMNNSKWNEEQQKITSRNVIHQEA
jgi:hypothetical protein